MTAQIYRNIADDILSSGADQLDEIYFIYDSNGFNVIINNEAVCLSETLNNQLPSQYSPIVDAAEYSVQMGNNMIELDITNNDNYASIQATGVDYISVSVQLKGQSASNICWAASVACIGQARNGTSYSDINIAKSIHGSSYNYPGSTAQALSALEDYCGVYDYDKPSSAAVPTETRIYNNISNGYPMYAQFVGGNVSHAVVIYGISRISGYISLMDPYSPSWVIAYNKYISSGTWLYGYVSPYASSTTIYINDHLYAVS